MWVKVRVFTLVWCPEAGGFDDEELTSFLGDRAAIDVFEHFFFHENTPILVLVITYRDGAPVARAQKASGRAPARDHDPARELTADEMLRYDALRSWRNQHARKTGRPPYVVFTNRHAVEIARKLPSTRAELADVQGIGASRVEDYGDELLAFLGSLSATVEQKLPVSGGPGDPDG